MNSKQRRRKVQQCIARDGKQCHYCGVDLMFSRGHKSSFRPQAATIDHIVPQGQGGTSELKNLVLACRRCNLARGITPYETFKAIKQLQKRKDEIGDKFGLSAKTAHEFNVRRASLWHKAQKQCQQAFMRRHEKVVHTRKNPQLTFSF